MKTIIPCIALMSLTACSSTPTVNGQKFQPDQVLSTAGDSSMPSWAEQGELQPWLLKDGKVFSTGITTLRGDDRPEAGARIAENNARANFSKTIENNLEFYFQNAEENTGMDGTQAHFVGSEVSKLTAHNMSVEGIWWKRYVQSSEDGSRHIYYKVYALVTMPETDLKQAIYAAVNKGVDQHRLSDKFQQQVDNHFDKLIGNNSVQPMATDKREPAAGSGDSHNQASDRQDSE